VEVLVSKSKARVTSAELTEVRTVLSRARSALKRIDYVAKARAEGWHYYGFPHPAEEVSMMRSALITSIDVLEKIEATAGYRELK
jgi:hypothetical protein